MCQGTLKKTRKETEETNRKQKLKMADLGTKTSMIILNINDLNTPIKKETGKVD